MLLLLCTSGHQYEKGEKEGFVPRKQPLQWTRFVLWVILVRSYQERKARALCIESSMVAITSKELHKAAIGWGRGVEPAPAPRPCW